MNSPAQAARDPGAAGFHSPFYLLLIYYWAMNFTRGDNSVFLIDPDIAYYLYVGPVALFVLWGAGYVIFKYSRIEPVAAVLGIYAIIVAAISAGRSDWRTLATVGLIALVLIVIVQVRPVISVRFINILFLLSIPLNSVLFYFEFSIYTALPYINADPENWWRISLFPSVASSAFIALFVLFLNWNDRSALRWPCMLLASYFLLLSGLRTAIFAAVFAGIYLVLRSYGFFKGAGARRAYLIAAMTFFLVSLFSTQVLMNFAIFDNAFFRTVIFRDEGWFADPEGQLFTASVRIWILNQHLGIIADHPWTGIGTFDLRMLTTGYEQLDDLTTGSEAFLTGLFARVGIVAVLFFYAILFMARPTRPEREDLAVCTRIFLLLGMTSYGSFVAPYDFVFLNMVIAVAGGFAVAGVPTRGAARRPAAPAPAIR